MQHVSTAIIQAKLYISSSCWIYTQTVTAFCAPRCSTVSTVRKPCAYGKFKGRNFPTKPQCSTKTSFDRKPHNE